MSDLTKDEARLLEAFRVKMLSATVKSINDGRERGFFIYLENGKFKSSPIRVGSEGEIGLKKETRQFRENRPNVLIGFHSHSGAEITPTSTPSDGDIRQAIYRRQNLMCIGNVEAPEDPEPYVDCYRVDEETGECTLLSTLRWKSSSAQSKLQKTTERRKIPRAVSYV